MSAPIPFNDLSRHAPGVLAELESAVTRVVRSGWYVRGPENAALEAELSEYLGVAHTALLANGTDALELALAALGVSPGDTVLTVANAGSYTSVATRLLGAEPVYCDIDPVTMLASPDTVRAAFDALAVPPKVIVVTHLYGALAPIAEIVQLADERGIPVLEDCAQSLGARVAGRHGGTFGAIATTSFYPTKNLGGMGDGGAVFTDDSQLVERVRSLSQYGWSSKYRISLPRGRNSRMDEMQAAIVRALLPRLDAANDRRRSIHSRYESSGSSTMKLVNRASESFIGHLGVAVVDASDRERAQAYFAERGISTDVHYPIADHRQPIQAQSKAWSRRATP